eukprot:261679-Chlamydomonas_euryale.AAC.1
MDGWMDGWMDGRMDGWVDGWMGGRMNGWMDGWMDGRMDEWMDGWMDGRADEERGMLWCRGGCLGNEVGCDWGVIGPRTQVSRRATKMHGASAWEAAARPDMLRRARTEWL